MAATGVTIEELPDETPAAAPAATPAADDAGAASDGSDDMPELESAEATAAPTEVHTADHHHLLLHHFHLLLFLSSHQLALGKIVLAVCAMLVQPVCWDTRAPATALWQP